MDRAKTISILEELLAHGIKWRGYTVQEIKEALAVARRDVVSMNILVGKEDFETYTEADI